MDSLITAAAGDPLGALNQVALRDDAPALALRGIAMAQPMDQRRTLLDKGDFIAKCTPGLTYSPSPSHTSSVTIFVGT
jgi:hypothetical protein